MAGGRVFPEREWHQCSAAEAGFDPSRLAAADAEIRARLPMVNGLLLVRGGKLVSESYYNGIDPLAPAPVYSIAKSVTGAVIGVLLADGKLRSLDQRVAEFLPELFGPAVPERTRELTLRHLLTMQSGFAWDLHDLHLLEGRVNDLGRVLTGPMASAPGESFIYDDANTHLLSWVVSRVSGRKLAEFADERLFQPIGITDWCWDEEDQAGQTVGGYGLSLAPRDLARFGLLHLEQGSWRGHRLMDPAFIRDGGEIQSKGGFPGFTPYGYLWWVAKEKGYRFSCAVGYGGQFIFVVPEADLVAVLVSDSRLGLDEINTARYVFTDVILAAL